MLTLKTTTKFKKDYKRMKKQGKDLTLLESVIDNLLNEKVLDEKHQDHPLVGKYIGFRECHILPDWLLIYAIDDEQLILTASRTGSHSDLFSL
ncbi:MAG: type II toxin-antitoxin system YafQ family toxin [Lachnospiraceae bacterium]|nr:type II toxin-antitoxin system YafQ family toxin [Lachnospiraceae bacterium]